MVYLMIKELSPSADEVTFSRDLFYSGFYVYPFSFKVVTEWFISFIVKRLLL